MIRKAVIYDFITLGKKFLVVILAMASWQNDDEKKG
jgi:DNA-binding HxlR family transcriptional regulator